VAKKLIYLKIPGDLPVYTPQSSYLTDLTRQRDPKPDQREEVLQNSLWLKTLGFDAYCRRYRKLFSFQANKKSLECREHLLEDVLIPMV
jgi:hypothetical protein